MSPALVADTLGSGGSLEGQSGEVDDLSVRESASEAGRSEVEERERDNAIVNEARDRFTRVASWESTARSRWLDDLKFDAGDEYNQYQWPNAVRRERDIDERPCLTINKTRQHNLHIINKGKKNKTSIKVRATGNGATAESAKVLNALMRHIEYTSNASDAYDLALGYAVKAGKGYVRLVTDWEDDESRYQIPFIRRVNDPLTIYLDPEAKEADKSDGRFAFVFDDMNRQEFKKLYPEFAEDYGAQPGLDDGTSWVSTDSIRMAEYFRVVELEDMLYAIPTPQGDDVMYRESELARDPDLLAKIKAMPGIWSRKTSKRVVEWYLIIGAKIAQRSIWPGKFIPIVPLVGEESVIQGEYDCKGHTRALLGPQRIYNYMNSVSVEYAGVQTKTPWIAPVEAIEGYEVDWANANRVNKSLLAYNGLNDAGEPIPPPQRIEPPVSMPAAIQGMQIALNDMMLASGQTEADMGQPGNERSANALVERKEGGENATYHFVDNKAVMIRAVGKQLLDLIPKLYSRSLAMNILADDGTSMEMLIDPSYGKACEIHKQGDAMSVQRVLFNPNVGKYDVQADVGEDWGTKRRETADKLGLIITQAPQLTGIIGDYLISNLDFDGAEEAAMRLRRMVPTQALGTGPTPNEQALQAQVEQLTDLLRNSMKELSESQIKLKGKDALRTVDTYNAFTQRLKVLIDGAIKEGSPIDPKDLEALIDATTKSALDTNLGNVLEASEPTLEANALSGKNLANEPPVPGARRGADGHWYVRNYANSGSWAVVS